MSPEFTVWIPGIVAAAIGLVAATFAAIVLTGRDQETPDRDTELEDLDQRKVHAVSQLRDLQHQRLKFPDKEYNARKQELERIAAQALKSRDALLRGESAQDSATSAASGDEAPAEPSAAVKFLVARPQLRGVLWGVGIVATTALIYTLVVREGTPEPANAPPGAGPMAGGPMAGGGRTPGNAAPRQVSPEIEAVIARLRQNPNDVEALSQGGHLLLRDMAFGQARPFIDRALQQDPEHPESLVHYAVLLMAEGKRPEGLQRLETVLAKHPKLAEGWFFRGMAGVQAGDEKLEKESFERYLALAPDGPKAAAVRSMLSGAAPGLPPGAHSPGLNVWLSKCASCHGVAGLGDGRTGQMMGGLPNMRTPEWQSAVADDAIRKAVAEGVVRQVEGKTRKMKAFPDLSAEKIESIVKLIRSWGREQN